MQLAYNIGDEVMIRGGRKVGTVIGYHIKHTATAVLHESYALEGIGEVLASDLSIVRRHKRASTTLPRPRERICYHLRGQSHRMITLGEPRQSHSDNFAGVLDVDGNEVVIFTPNGYSPFAEIGQSIMDMIYEDVRAWMLGWREQSGTVYYSGGPVRMSRNWAVPSAEYIQPTPAQAMAQAFANSTWHYLDSSPADIQIDARNRREALQAEISAAVDRRMAEGLS